MDRLRNPNGYRRLRQIHFPGTVDTTCPRVKLNGADLQDIHPNITPEELQAQFTPNADTRRRMRRSQRLRARLRQANKRLNAFDKNEKQALDKEGSEDDMFFPLYADRPGSFQADICFIPENQVFNRYQGIVCLISTNRKIAWAITSSERCKHGCLMTSDSSGTNVSFTRSMHR